MSAIGDAPRAASGFTLIEMLVVVGVTALVSTIMFPSIQRSLDYWNCRASFTAIRSGLEGARGLALRSGMPARFVMARDGSSFAVTGRPPVPLGPTVRLLAAPAAIDFYGDGSASGGRIGIMAAGRRTWFDVSADTGLTRMVR